VSEPQQSPRGLARVADWRSVRTGVITALVLAALGLLGRWAIETDADLLALLLWLVLAVAVGAWVFALDRRMRRMETEVGATDSDVPLPLQGRVNVIALDLAHIEARDLVAKLGKAESDAVLNDAVTLVAGARFARWKVVWKPDGPLPRLNFTPPPWNPTRITYGFVPPVTRESVDELGAFLSAHGVPVGPPMEDD
jgi:hypothetical protein